jgi:hypothetical protein
MMSEGLLPAQQIVSSSLIGWSVILTGHNCHGEMLLSQLPTTGQSASLTAL